ncbi:hypothetical protein Q1695_005550 [Nippostrongylus brasiliensis]|nr:hypothetical protein Q1695_005550 [Nippostrongylus brasiliensis]
MDVSSRVINSTPRAHPKTGRKRAPGRGPAIDSIDAFDQLTTSSTTDQMAENIEILLKDPTIPSYVRAIISLLLEERKRIVAMLDKIRELNDDTSILRAANMNVRSMLTGSQDPAHAHTPKSFEFSSSPPADECDAADRKERSRSIVIANVPESTLRLPSERVDDDFRRVRFILDFLDIECPITSVYRLGRYHTRRPRLIKVILPSSVFATLVVRRAPRLKFLRWQRRPFVRPSLPKEEREKLRGQGAGRLSRSRLDSSSSTANVSRDVVLNANRNLDASATSIVTKTCSTDAVSVNLNQ